MIDRITIGRGASRTVLDLPRASKARMDVAVALKKGLGVKAPQQRRRKERRKVSEA